jgi:hypothetical protein
MEQALGKLTFGKLIGFVFPGVLASFSFFLFVDTILQTPGTLGTWVTSDFTGIATFSVLLLGSGVVLGPILDNLHFALLVPSYMRTTRYGKLTSRESPKIDLVRLLVLRRFTQYGSEVIGDGKDLALFREVVDRLKIENLEWWFIFPLSGGKLFSLFLEEYYSFLQFFGGMAFGLISLAVTFYFYSRTVIDIGAIHLGSYVGSGGLLIALIIAGLGIFCVRRAYLYYLLCHETQVNLIFGAVVDLAFRHRMEPHHGGGMAPARITDDHHDQVDRQELTGSKGEQAILEVDEQGMNG